MTSDIPHIDPYLFEKQYNAFQKFTQEQSGVSFMSFASNPYTEKQEGYKYEVQRIAREKLAFQSWKKHTIGSGVIVDAIISSIEFSENNLVAWQARFGKTARPHQRLYVSRNEHEVIEIETCFYNLYHEANDERSFKELVEIFGKQYPLIAYLFFIKDKSKYLPIAPRYFDQAFKLLGASFITSRLCSWDNYAVFIRLIDELKSMLSEKIHSEVSLLDAHSFAWILSDQMAKNNKLAVVDEYLKLTCTEKDAVIKARIGQGQFRDKLIKYWAACSVTGCREISLLRASHIKPWSQSTLEERLSLHNGLLLSPDLDACFDSGFISFDDSGKMIISDILSKNDRAALGIKPEMRLIRIDNRHKKYLQYHRDNIFQQDR